MNSQSRTPLVNVVPTLIALLIAPILIDLSTVRAADPSWREPLQRCERGSNVEKTMPLWPARPYTVHLPGSYDGTTPHPVVIALHGRGGNRKTLRLETCPGQNPKSRACLDAVADCEGFIVVYPDGTYESPLARSIRSFNAGGGVNGYVCISGYACEQNIDDVQYVSDLLDALETNYKIDPARVYVTGYSNGAGLSHRLACELSHRIAAIAPVSGGNQYAAVDSCVTSRSVPVLEIHGMADPISPFEGGYESCADPGTCGRRVPIPDTISGWASRNGCPATPLVENWADLKSEDGTTVTQMTYSGCSGGSEVVLLKVNGGGHTWPGGSSKLSVRIVGRVSREFNANKVMLEFFKAHPMW